MEYSSSNQLGPSLEALLELSRNNALAVNGLIQSDSEHKKQLAVTNEKLDSVSDNVADLMNWRDTHEQNEKLSFKQWNRIRQKAGHRIYKILGMKKNGKELTLESKKISKVYGSLFFRRIYADLYSRLDVVDWQEIKAVDYDKAIEFVSTWDNGGDIKGLKDEAEENWGVNHPEIPVEQYLGVLFS